MASAFLRVTQKDNEEVKKTITFLTVTWFTICQGPQNWVLKQYQTDIWLWYSFGGYIHPPLQVTAWNYRMCKIYNQHQIGYTKKWENIKNKTRNNNYKIYGRKLSRKLLFVSFR